MCTKTKRRNSSWFIIPIEYFYSFDYIHSTVFEELVSFPHDDSSRMYKQVEYKNYIF